MSKSKWNLVFPGHKTFGKLYPLKLGVSKAVYSTDILVKTSQSCTCMQSSTGGYRALLGNRKERKKYIYNTRTQNLFNWCQAFIKSVKLREKSTHETVLK